jgi:hypothetical protein
MDTDSNYIAFTAHSVDELIKPDMRAWYEQDEIKFFRSESDELHPKKLKLMDNDLHRSCMMHEHLDYSKLKSSQKKILISLCS